MAKLIVGRLTKFTVNGVDLSDHTTSIDAGDTSDEVDVTGLGETYREFIRGLQDATVTTTFTQDYAGSSVDATVFPLYNGNTAGTLKITPDTSGTVVYTLVAKPYSYNPISGGVGDANTVDVTWRNAGTAGLTRGTS